MKLLRYVQGIDQLLSTSIAPGIKLYQLKGLKSKSLKPLLCRTPLLYQTEYRLIGKMSLALDLFLSSQNIDSQRAYTVYVSAKRVTFCTVAHFTPSLISKSREFKIFLNALHRDGSSDWVATHDGVSYYWT